VITTTFRPCAIIPTYNNPRTVRSVVERVRAYLPDVVVVNDGSGPEGTEAVNTLGRDGLAHVVHREANGGKGAAVKTGFAVARELGYSHALQIDADGQHNLEDIPRFIETARSNPQALILGHPTFDHTVPKGRLIGRQITIFWTHIETGGRRIVDPMCGFRVYPLAAVADLKCGDRMDFDIEIAVKLVWKGVPVVNLPTKVRYLTAAEGGVSNFRMFEDNVKISWLHTRLVVGAVLRLLTWPVRALTS
jgi:glycosyltransferase involved in cell wall biosynthesis